MSADLPQAIVKDLRRIGNSTGVLLPASLLSHLGLEAGDPVWIGVDEAGRIVLSASEPKKPTRPAGRGRARRLPSR
jgi:antitoxin component of MazEF toxin-antitoxin module